MITTKKISLSSILLILFIGVGSLSFGQNDYEETMDWIKGKMENFKLRDRSSLGVSNRWNYTDTYTYKVISWSDCEVTIEETDNYVTDQNTSRNDRVIKKIIKFNVGDLKSITYSTEGNGGFTIKTYNDAKKIQINPNGNTTVVNTFTFRADELGELDGQPERFIKAWKHAMSLCGAKEEKF